MERLGGVANRPGHGERFEGFGVAEANGFDEGAATVAGGRPDCSVNRSHGAVRLADVGTDPGAERGPVGFRAHELDLQPVTTLAGVLKQYVVSLVTGHGAADFDEDVEVAVAVPVGEGDAVPL